MARINVTKRINASIDRVFAVVSDIPNIEQQIDAITKIEMLSDGPVGVGTRWRETRIMFGKEATEEMWITEFTKNKSYTVEAESCGTHYRSEYQFVAKEDGTEVSLTFEGQPQTFVGKLMSPLTFLMKGMLVKMLDKDLEDCRKLCETRANA